MSSGSSLRSSIILDKSGNTDVYASDTATLADLRMAIRNNNYEKVDWIMRRMTPPLDIVEYAIKKGSLACVIILTLVHGCIFDADACEKIADDDDEEMVEFFRMYRCAGRPFFDEQTMPLAENEHLFEPVGTCTGRFAQQCLH